MLPAVIHRIDGVDHRRGEEQELDQKRGGQLYITIIDVEGR